MPKAKKPAPVRTYLSIVEAQQRSTDAMAQRMLVGAMMAWETLEDVMADREAHPAARVAAATTMLKIAGAMKEQTEHVGEVVIRVVRGRGEVGGDENDEDR
jgi:hypothetical protein